jgi:fibronectin-binding autotransporter adhesin
METLGGTFHRGLFAHSHPVHPWRSAATAAAAVAGLLALLVTSAVAGVVSSPTQAALLSALAGGGDVTFSCDGTIYLTQTVAVTNSSILDATGHTITISGSNAVSVFYVEPGINFTLVNLTVANGSTTGATGANAVTNGGPGQSVVAGGLYNANGIVSIINCAFVSNSVTGGTGGFGELLGGTGGNAQGGAIYNDSGTLNVTNSTFIDNVATGGLGGPTESYGGDSGVGSGGAIGNNLGLVNLAGTTFTGNQAVGGIPALAYEGLGAATGEALGGAVATLAGSVNVSNCAFSTNSASVPIVGAPTDVVTNGSCAGGAIYQAGGTLQVTWSTFANNSVFPGVPGNYDGTEGNGMGGAIYAAGTLLSTNCSFTANVSTGGGYGAQAGDGDGGALYNAGSATVVNATFAGNAAVGGEEGEGYEGQVFDTIPGVANGGGIFNSNMLVLLGSTLSGNAALAASNCYTCGSEPGMVGGPAFGGAIYNLGTILATNDTLYGNAALGGAAENPNYGPAGPAFGGNAAGGALYNTNASATLDYVTISDNTAVGGHAQTPGSGVGGGIDTVSGSVLLLDSIVAASPSGTNIYVTSNSLTDGGDNISSDSSFAYTAPGSMTDINPDLGTFGFYGGPTETIPLLSGSPAIDAAGAGGCPATDQRGLPRPYGAACDIGAFEYYPSYTIQGHVYGNQVPGAVVSAGIFTGIPNPVGDYTVSGVIAGSYQVSLSAPGILPLPAAQAVTVGPNATRVNFTACALNSINFMGRTNHTLYAAFAGTNGQSFIVQTSIDLTNWSSLSTNQISSNNLFQIPLAINPSDRVRFFRTQTP